jgi:hypothetical protein
MVFAASFPVFDRELRNTPKLFRIVGDDSQAMHNCNRRDLHIVGSNGCTQAFQVGADTSKFIGGGFIINEMSKTNEESILLGARACRMLTFC